MTTPPYEQARTVAPGIRVVLARNPSAMTLEGTNTYLLQASGAAACVVDPGPDDPAHLSAVLAAAGEVEAILSTHGHPDHAAGAGLLAERTGAPIVRLTAARTLGGLRIEPLPTPGHSADSTCFVLPGAVVTGDTVLGRGTSVLGPEDDALARYLDSLATLTRFAGRVGLPGHGPVLPDVAAAAEAYLRHRRERIAQVRAALERLGPQATPAEVVREVYADTDPALWPVAERSVAATLRYLG